MSKESKLAIPNELIARLHRVYQEVSGLQLGLKMLWADEYIWGEWIRHGWTEADLRLVCAHLKREYPRYAVKMMKFRSLIGDPMNFREKLAEAVAMQRNARKPQDARQSVLKAVGRVEEQKDDVRLGGAVAKELCDGMRKAIDDRIQDNNN